MYTTDAGTQTMQGLLDEGQLDVRAYEHLLARCCRRLTRLTRKMLRSYPHVGRWEETEDVLQAAAMRLHRSLLELRPPTVGAFWALATMQIRRTLIDLARHHFGPHGQASHYEGDLVLGEEMPHGRHGEPIGRSLDPAALQEWTEFHEVMDRLPADERDVMHLAWYGGLSQREIADALNISVPTVQRRWHAARLRLQRHYQGQTSLNDAE